VSTTRRQALQALAAPALLGLGACGRADDPQGPLDFWAMGREAEVVAQLLPAFHERHPGIRVHVQQLPWTAAHE
jgi:multiple sugar transport system substrate-binding protein